MGQLLSAAVAFLTLTIAPTPPIDCELSLEYQIPIQANDALYLVGFIDSGTIERSAKIQNYRVSVGVGMRIAIPQTGPVPIALDF